MVHLRQVDADGQAEEFVDAPHPVGVALREVVVDRDDVHALAGQRIEVGRQRRDERLAFARAHFRDLAVVQRHAAHELNVEVAHRQRALAGLAHHGEGLGQAPRRVPRRRRRAPSIRSVLALSASSDSAAIAGSRALISRTTWPYCLSSRSLRLPNMRVRMFEIIWDGRPAQWRHVSPAGQITRGENRLTPRLTADHLCRSNRES